MRSYIPVCFAIVVGLLVPSVSSAQQRPAAEPKQQSVMIPAGGTELFRALLDRAGIKPVPHREMWNIRNYDDVMVIVLGSSNGWNAQVNDPANVATWAVNSGAAVLFATDSHTQIGSRWQHDPMRGHRLVSARIDWGWVHNNTPEATLHGFEECPYVVPLTRNDSRVAPDPESPLAAVFKGLNRVATNSPAPMRVHGFAGEFRYALAAYPEKSYLADEQGNFQGWLGPDILFAVGGMGPDEHIGRPYRYLAMADHSIFINQMLIEPGTQNLELTYRVIEFLNGPSPRKRCLFIENGWVVERFDGLRQAFAKQKPPLPMPNLSAMQEKLVDLGNQIIDKVQTEDVPFKIVDRATSVPGLIRILMIPATIYGAWFLMRRMFSARHPVDIPAAPTVAGVPTGPPGVFDRRQKELVRRNNLYEPVRDMIREFFASIGVAGVQGELMPRLVVSDSVRKPDSLYRAVTDFWKLAYGKPQEVTAIRWRELEPYFARLQKAHAEGKWRFVLEPESAGSTA